MTQDTIDTDDDDSNGAIDNTFAESEREAFDQIDAKLDEYNREILPHDIAIDLVYHRPVFVVSVEADTCAEYWESGDDFDLTTYKAHPYLPVASTNTVYRCVYLPTKPGDIRHEAGDKTYDFPAGRLARVPVENLFDSATRPQEHRSAAVVASMLAATTTETSTVEAVAREAVGDEVVDDAKARMEE